MTDLAAKEHKERKKGTENGLLLFSIALCSFVANESVIPSLSRDQFRRDY